MKIWYDTNTQIDRQTYKHSQEKCSITDPGQLGYNLVSDITYITYITYPLTGARPCDGPLGLLGHPTVL
jgi:hypothetical protein